MPPLAIEFRQRVSEGLSLAQVGDSTVTIAAGRQAGWHISRVELLYELAFLRMFIAWETLLEQTFYRYLCGYLSVGGVLFNPVAGKTFFRDVTGLRKCRLIRPSICVVAQSVCRHKPSKSIFGRLSARSCHWLSNRSTRRPCGGEAPHSSWPGACASALRSSNYEHLWATLPRRSAGEVLARLELCDNSPRAVAGHVWD